MFFFSEGKVCSRWIVFLLANQWVTCFFLTLVVDQPDSVGRPVRISAPPASFFVFIFWSTWISLRVFGVGLISIGLRWFFSFVWILDKILKSLKGKKSGFWGCGSFVDAKNVITLHSIGGT